MVFWKGDILDIIINTIVLQWESFKMSWLPFEQEHTCILNQGIQWWVAPSPNHKVVHNGWLCLHEEIVHTWSRFILAKVMRWLCLFNPIFRIIQFHCFIAGNTGSDGTECSVVDVHFPHNWDDLLTHYYWEHHRVFVSVSFSPSTTQAFLSLTSHSSSFPNCLDGW
jgi:hypothetical protein